MNLGDKSSKEIDAMIERKAKERSTSGHGCPKCGGLRQWPAGCCIRLPDDQCEAKPVDVIGASRFVGGAGFVPADAPRADAGDFLRRHTGDLRAIPPTPTPNPDCVLYDITIQAKELRREGAHIPADVAGALYSEAIWAEMSKTVREATRIRVWAVSEVEGSYWSRLLTERDERAIVKVETSAEVKRKLGPTAITNAGMSFMFQLRDDILAVIRGFEPPEGAWVADEAEPQGEPKMPDAQDAQDVQDAAQAAEGRPASGRAPSVPQLNFEDHAPALAKAIVGVHYPQEVQQADETGDHSLIESRVANYIGDAKQFIALFNMALTLADQLMQSRSTQAPPPNEPAMQERAS